MFLRVLVNISDQRLEMRLAFNPYAPKRALKQRPAASVHFVESPGISVEQVRKSLAGHFRKRLILDPHQEMKMVPQQTISVSLRYRHDMPGVKLEKIMVILLLEKDILTVVAAAVDMLKRTRDQGHRVHFNIQT